MALFNRILTLNQACGILKNQKYIFIYSDCLMYQKRAGDLFSGQDAEEGRETRGYVCRESLSPGQWIKIGYRQNGASPEGHIQDGFEAEFFDNTIGVKSYGSLRRTDMSAFVKEVHNLGTCLVVDFTVMNIRFLGAFLSALSMLEWENLLFCYTEPKAYVRARAEGESRFDLKNISLGFEEIPGLETMGDSTEKSNWVVFLGFEEERLNRMGEEASSMREYIVPVACIPAMRVQWHNYAIDANRNFLEKSEQRDVISYVSAVNPFDVYNYLCKEKDNHKQRMIISPVSTKPVILGTLMYVLENRRDMMLWDSPCQVQPNTEENGPSLFYDLSYYIKQVTNPRYIRKSY